tara:strand:+ start:287 stop:793 length:507 start_codon:yes stop_codon:yes gene_type:complete
MENENLNKPNFAEKFLDILKTKKRMITIVLILFLIIFLFTWGLKIYKENENSKIAEKFIEAGVQLSKSKKQESKIIFEEIILSKNQFYSSLALSKLIENDLESDSQKILNYFVLVEKINKDKDHKDLIKLKKALYLFKISKDTEGKKLLEEIIADNSIWKDAAKDILD